MHQISASSGDEAYLQLLRIIHTHGNEVHPRGQATWELLDTTTYIAAPEQAPPLNVRRNFSSAIAATETVHLLGEMSSLDQLNLASRGRFSRYADDGRLLGAYGPRLNGQIERVVDQLRLDPDTRQAVAVIWNRDEVVTRDTPCTVALTFRVRRQRLGLKVHMRSNDVWLGVPYDWFMFSRLQLAVAEVLGLEPGPYVHHADSLHLYHRDADAASQAVNAYGSIIQSSAESKVARAFSNRSSPDNPTARFEEWADVRRAARRVAFQIPTEEDVDVNSPIHWYIDHVPMIPDHLVLCVSCGYVVPITETTRRSSVVHSTASSQAVLTAPLCASCYV